MSIYLYPYKTGSRSCRALAMALGARVIRRESSAFREGRGRPIINWGASNVPYTVALNPPQLVGIAGNKRMAFDSLAHANVSIPSYTSLVRPANQWLDDDQVVVARQILTGHSGAGISIINPGDDLPEAPLYVKYIPKRAEYRVHVTDFYKDDQHEPLIIHIQQKRRRIDVPEEEVNWQVRNHDNGFIFATENVDAPQMVLDESKKAIRALGLHFGAVDVILNEGRQCAYVLEVNTAPGLEGQTITRYAEAFRGYFNG